MEALFIHLLKSSGILLLFVLSYILFLKKETFFSSNRVFLISGLLIAIVLPFVEITKTIVLAPVETTEPNFLNLDNFTATEIEPALVPWLAILTVIYALGVLFFIIRLLVQLAAIHGIKKYSEVVLEDDLYHVKTKKTISPFSFFKHIFYNPNQFNSPELSTIINHEKVHANELHSLDILITEIIAALFWFNPIIWFYRLLVKQNLEFIADAKTCELNQDKKGYQYLMLKQALGHQSLSIVNPFYNSIIKKRIVMLNQNQSKTINRLKFLIVLPLLGVFLVAFNTTEVVEFSETVTVAFTNPIPEKENNTVQKDKTSTVAKIITLSLDKNTTNESLENMKKDLARNGADFSYIVVRNNAKEIINISMDINGKNNEGDTFSGNYNTSSKTPIKPISIIYDNENNSISFWNSDTIPKVIAKKINNNSTSALNGNKEKKTFTFKNSDDDSEITITAKNTYLTKKDDQEQPLYYLDGNISNALIVNKLDPEEIAAMNVLKGESAIQKYGETAKNGVIEITTKKNTKPLYYVDGYEVKEFEDANTDNIKSVNVLKGDAATKKYGERAKNGVVEISSKKEAKDNQFIIVDNIHINVESGETTTLDKNNASDIKKALFIIDGKEATKKQIKKLDPNEIKSMNVIKGEAATKKYGNKGKNGVIEIILKQKK